MAQRQLSRSVRIFAVGLAVLCVSGWWGCGADPQGRLPIGGSVAIDGTPLASGTILFAPTGADKSFTAGSPIQDGKFSIAREQGLPPGEYRATVFAPNEAARPKGKPGQPRPAAPNLLAPGQDAKAVQITADSSTSLTLEFAAEKEKQ